MARVPGRVAVYRTAEVFRERCLLKQESLLWPGRSVWTLSNISMLWAAFMERPETGKGTFLEKWEQQLSGEGPDVHCLAVEVIALYYLFPLKIEKETKLGDIETILSWKLEKDRPDLSLVDEAFDRGIGNTGAFYSTGKPWQVAFYLKFAQRTIEGAIDVRSAESCKEVARVVLSQIPKSTAARHIILHLLFPDQFERISSQKMKRRIVEAFSADSGGEADPDLALQNIRTALQNKYSRDYVDFYDKEISPSWRGDDDEPIRYWIEKTIVKGRGDRESGEFALGKALWSPKQGKDGKDIYRFMREPKPGDVVFHLVDNYGITDISRVDSEFQEFEGIDKTEWGVQPSYVLRLRSTVKMDPPLKRDSFFGPPFDARLSSLITGGTKNLFYNRDMSLNQGAYLTPVPVELVRILDDAYKVSAHKSLAEYIPEIGAVSGTPPIPTHQLDSAGPKAGLVDATNLTELELDELESLLRSKRQLILEGPPGGGKTYVAELLARYFTGNPLHGRTNNYLLTVQFHQSYSYEDFIQGIRPETNSAGQLQYHVRSGIFKAFCDEARKSSEPFVIIIDEINRGNISRIFGELLFLLEYRTKELPLPYDHQLFSIPENIYLIGTMNTTDRSLAQIDYALRRRFYFYRLSPVVNGRALVLEKVLSKLNVTPEVAQKILRLFISLNKQIQHRLGEHFQVGHSHFMHPEIEQERVLMQVWNRSVMPLLEEYFHNSRDRETVLADFAMEKLLEVR